MLMTAVGSPPTYKPALATLGVIAGEGSTKQLLVTVCFLSNVPFKFGESIGPPGHWQACAHLSLIAGMSCQLLF